MKDTHVLDTDLRQTMLDAMTVAATQIQAIDKTMAGYAWRKISALRMNPNATDEAYINAADDIKMIAEKVISK